MAESEYSIAIIGMAGRFPEADDIGEFWENLKAGKDCITRKPETDTDTFTGAFGVLRDIYDFDAGFFRIPAAEARDSDPEQRIMMELAYHALENAGYDSFAFRGKTGLYVSFDNGAYVWNNIINSGGDWFDAYQLNKVHIATRAEKIAYRFDFRGPAVMSEYACASSLNAIHQACQALLNFECDMAVSGGITAELRQEGYPSYLTTESAAGVIRPFDRDADGLVPGSAAGAVVLKRYEDAVADHDHIVAVIKGTFVNNDGSRKAGFAAPSVFGQEECMRSVLAVSEVSEDEVSYYEAHGTATELGDAIEVRMLKNVYGSRPLKIGSVKSNIGHTNMAAGVANVIKTALMLENRLLVPTINHSEPADELKTPGCAITVCTQTEEWKSTGQRIAVCGAVGMGGANAMAVLGECVEDVQRGEEEAKPYLFVYSGASEKAAKKISEDVAAYVTENDIRFDDAAYTLQCGRRALQHRAFAIADRSRKRVITTRRPHDTAEFAGKRTVFVFSGAGSFDIEAARKLYRSSSVFRAEMDSVMHACERAGADRIREAFLECAPDEIDNIYGLQLILAIECAQARTLARFGIEPDAVTGHSNGEYAAAVISGILTLEDTSRMLKVRSELVETLPEGAMINIAESPEKVRGMLTDGVVIGAYNGQARCMVSGPREKIDGFEKVLIAEDLRYSRIAADRAGHCYLMDDIADDFGKAISDISFGEFAVDQYSGYADIPCSSDVMKSAEYWKAHLSMPVRYDAAVQRIAEDKDSIFIEIGLGDMLTSITRKTKSDGAWNTAFAFSDSPASDDLYSGMLSLLGNMWMAGKQINWELLYDEKPYRVKLTEYPFERSRYVKELPHKAQSAADTGTLAVAGGLDEKNMEKSRYIVDSHAGDVVFLEHVSERYDGSFGAVGIYEDLERTKEEYRRKYFSGRGVTLLKDIPGYDEMADRLTAACIMDYFRSLDGFDPGRVYTFEKLLDMGGVIGKYIPFVDFFVKFMCDNGYASDDHGLLSFMEKGTELPGRRAVLAECMERLPDCCAYMELAVYASDFYSEVFRGEREGSTVIYHDGRFDFLDSFEKRMPAYSYTDSCIDALAETVAKAAETAEAAELGRKVRILEVGAGSGEMTDRILPMLDGCDCEYWFTDIKRSLVLERQANEKPEHADMMRYGVIDISEDPAKQGFTERYFDVILLYDVIQATTDIRKTIGNIRWLLSDGGCFSFVQTCGGSDMLNLIFGYAPGWWNYYEDPERDRITMPAEGWREILSGCGYDDVISIPEDGTSNAYLFVMKSADSTADIPGITQAADGIAQQHDTADGAQKCTDILRSREKNRNYLELAGRKSNVRIEFYDGDIDLSRYDRVTGIGTAGGIIDDSESGTSGTADRSPGDGTDIEAAYRSESDRAVAAIINETIGEKLGLDDDLYDFGMDSLMAMMIASKIRNSLGLDVQLSDMYGLSTIREISDALEGFSPLKAEAGYTEKDASEKEDTLSLEDLLDEI